MTTPHVHLHLEQFLLRDNRRPTEQLLHNQGKRNQLMKVGGESDSTLGPEGTLSDQRCC